MFKYLNSKQIYHLPSFVEIPVILAKDIADLGEGGLFEIIFKLTNIWLKETWGDVAAWDHTNVNQGFACLVDPAHLNQNDVFWEMIVLAVVIWSQLAPKDKVSNLILLSDNVIASMGCGNLPRIQQIFARFGE